MPKILLLDIETAPNQAYVWGLFDQNISGDQVVDSSYVLCWSARWLHETEIMFSSVEKYDDYDMMMQLHTLLDEADVVVHYNGTKFDIPVINKEFVKLGIHPPSPYKQVDLYQVVRRNFRFESNKLDYVSQALGLGAKTKHAGFQLWVQCMEGNIEAWEHMEKYNRQDVALLVTLYRRLLPWIQKHPNMGALTGTLCCPKCGHEHVTEKGHAYTAMMKYRLYQCNSCHGWMRGNRSKAGVEDTRLVNVIG